MAKSKENNPLKTKLFNAINDGAANVLRVLLNNAEPSELVEAVSDNLFWACKENNIEMVEMLLQKGANPNTPVAGRLPLHQACKSGNENIVKMLLAAGADFNHTDKNSIILFEKIGGSELWTFLELAEGCRKGDLNFIYNGAKHINQPRLIKFIDWKTSIKPSDIHFNNAKIFKQHLEDVRNLKIFVEKNNKSIFTSEEREEHLKKIQDMSILTLSFHNNIMMKVKIEEVFATTDDFVPSDKYLKVMPVDMLGGD